MDRREPITKEKEAIAYLEDLQSLGSVPGLASIQRLLAGMGNPQEKLVCVHIAGTNGKGSLAAYLSTVLKEGGYRTGKYCSPAVFSRREQYQINGRAITKAEFAEGVECVRQAALEMAEEKNVHPTVFEVETALAFWYFEKKKCDIVVLETGFGGALDATNIITKPLLAVLTPISMDHMGILGKTISEIAAQKAGIIKNACYVISAAQSPQAMEIIRERCKKTRSSLIVAEPSRISKVRYGIKKQKFSYKNYEDMVIQMAGRFQVENAILAIEAVDALSKLGFLTTKKQLKKGLWETVWQGRFSVIAEKPLFVIDGAHNLDGAKKLADSLTFYFTNKRIIYIMGILKDKEYEKIVEETASLATQIITVTPTGPRAMPAYELAGVAGAYHSSVTAADSLEEAVEISFLLADKDTVIVAFGSLTFLGRLSEIVKNRDRIRRDTHGK